MEKKIPRNSDISEKIVNFERLAKIFEMNDRKITVPFDSENFSQMHGSRLRKFREFPIFR